ncbi:MAG: hypothetical protein HRU34_09840 [Richelia sp.]|nr:hypothetical protein [Richelia sp.]CDN11063.1 hypothetical protein RintRC_3364 [Richelia intracellularis]
MRDDFTKFSTIDQWFQTLIHPALMQRPFFNWVLGEKQMLNIRNQQ